MGNRIEEIGQLNLPVLTVLNLNYNKITAISGLRGLKKLEELSLEKNLIEEPSMQEIGFNLISLKELNLRGNKITAVTKLTGYPNVEKVILDRNPLSEIEPTAFKGCTELKSLYLNRIQLPNYTGDLKFLRYSPNLLVSCHGFPVTPTFF